jgi:hypothetical protein
VDAGEGEGLATVVSALPAIWRKQIPRFARNDKVRGFRKVLEPCPRDKFRRALGKRIRSGGAKQLGLAVATATILRSGPEVPS